MCTGLHSHGLFLMTKRPTAIIIGGLVAGLAVVLLPWALTFWGATSGDPANWGQFGDYLGGTLATLISVLALISLLYTFGQQQKQIELLVKQANRSDILSAIDRLEADFDKALKRYQIKISGPDGCSEMSGFDVLFNLSFQHYLEVIPNKSEIIETADREGGIAGGDIRLLCCEMFATAAGELNQIRIYSEHLEVATGSNVLSRYYERKYRIAYQRLSESGYLSTQWRVGA